MDPHQGVGDYLPGVKLDCNLGKVPTFLNPTWNPASAPSVKQFLQADAVSKGKTPLEPTGVVMDFTLIHVYNRLLIVKEGPASGMREGKTEGLHSGLRCFWPLLL